MQTFVLIVLGIVAAVVVIALGRWASSGVSPYTTPDMERHLIDEKSRARGMQEGGTGL